eukprot:gene1459-1801_t
MLLPSTSPPETSFKQLQFLQHQPSARFYLSACLPALLQQLKHLDLFLIKRDESTVVLGYYAFDLGVMGLQDLLPLSLTSLGLSAQIHEHSRLQVLDMTSIELPPDQLAGLTALTNLPMAVSGLTHLAVCQVLAGPPEGADFAANELANVLRQLPEQSHRPKLKLLKLLRHPAEFDDDEAFKQLVAFLKGGAMRTQLGRITDSRLNTAIVDAFAELATASLLEVFDLCHVYSFTEDRLVAEPKAAVIQKHGRQQCDCQCNILAADIL